MEDESPQPREPQPQRPEQAFGLLRDGPTSSSHSPSADSHDEEPATLAPDAAEISAHSQASGCEVPTIPTYLLDPRPIVLIGTLLWTLALLANMLFFAGDMRTVILCAVGVGVGAMGTAVYALQRRAVIRGTKGAQAGLDFDRG